MRFYFSRKEQYAVAVLLLAILGASLVLSYAYGTKAKESKTPAPPFLESAVQTTEISPKPQQPVAEGITVHVTGAVRQPGVYTFQSGARINDAIAQAGGARSDGYPDALNLAAKLEDGQKIYLPTKTEWEKTREAQGCPPLVESGASNAAATKKAAPSTTTAQPAATNSTEPPMYTGPKPLPKGIIKLNTATKEQLMELPGVGEVTAQNILAYRDAHGPFTDFAELLNVPKIGAKTLEKITPYLTL